ncbi:type IV toxin-antitoxin system AbiEi family antitoxin domain-containing protein [Kocuria palustris]|uniref:type IV toxin-antitoxin system AbiEi family antitoxin domain-containing protein n=1 Tax=Kocuria palustris TaxID=71999 RepID=UPI003BF80DD0
MTTHRTSPITPAAQPPTPIADRVAALVQAHPGGIGRTDIARALGVKAETVGSALSRAVAEGDIERAGRGVYKPTPAAEQRAAHGRAAATDGRERTTQQHGGIHLKYGRMGRQEGLLICAADGFGEAFIPREALPDLRRRLARAQADIEARP